MTAPDAALIAVVAEAMEQAIGHNLTPRMFTYAAEVALEVATPVIERRAKIELLERMKRTNNDQLPASVVIGIELKALTQKGDR